MLSSNAITPLSNIIAGYDSELEQILLKALAHEPDNRYQTAGEFENALQRHLASLDYDARPTNLGYLSNLKNNQPPDLKKKKKNCGQWLNRCSRVISRETPLQPP